MASSNFRVKNGAEITEVLYVSGASSLRNVGILGPVDPDVAGLTVHGDISATGTIFVAGSAVGGSSSSDFASGAGGSFNEIQYNNSGLLDGAGGLNYNESLQGLGIGVVANQKLTVAGNISSTGNIFTNGNITVDGTVDGRDIAGDAANVVANSASWDSAYSSLKANSAEYESTFSTLLANSAEYESVLSTTQKYSADWTYVAENSAGASGDLTVAGRLTVGADEVFEDNRLTVVGNISALGTIYAGGSAIGGAGTAGTPAGANKSIQYNDSGALNGGNFFYDESNERVGIGTSSPNKELTVIGSISSQDIFIGDTSPVITIKDTDSSGDTQLGYIQFTDTNDQVKGSIGFTNASDRNLRFTNNTEGDVRFLTNSAVSVAITSAGNVGIGTTAPGEALTVAGNVSANGDVFAKSVIVDNQTIIFREADGTIDRESGAKITTTDSGSVAIQASTVGVSSTPTVVVITSGGTVAAVASGQEASVEAEGFPSSFTSSISTLATVFASGGDSRDWNSTYSNVNTNSADWTYVAQNSAEAGDRFRTIALSANRAGAAIGADIVADTASDTVTLCAGPNIQLVSDPSTDTLMISSAPGAHFNSSELASNSASWNDAATNAYAVSADIAEISAISGRWNRTATSLETNVVGNTANWNTAYTHSQGSVTDHNDVSNAGSGQIITSDERDRFGRTWTNLSTNSSQWAEVKADIAEVAALSATWNDAATNAYTVSADIAEIAAVSANWNTAYTRSDGTVTVHSDVSNAGSGQIITTDERDRFSRTWTNLSTNSSQWAEVKADIAEVAALSARYTQTALSLETNVVPATGSWNSTNTTLVANSARYDRTALSLETNVVGSTANWNQAYITSNNNFSTLNSNSARWDTNANTEVAAASADWNYTAANTAISVAFDVTNNGSGAYRFNNGGFTNDDNPTLHLQRGKTYRFRVNASGHPFLIKTQAGTGTSNQYLSGVSGAGAAVGNVDFEVRHDAPRQLFYQCQAHSGMVGAIHIGDATATTEVFNNSANWNTAYTTSNSLEAARTHLASASSRWDQSYLSMTTDISGNSANWDQAYITSNNNFSTLNSNSARWDTNANTELAAISARYTRTALSVETNVVPATGSWNSTNTTLKSLSTAAGTAVANKMLVVDGNKDIDFDGGDITATNVTVQGDLTVQGATIQADTVVTVTSALSVTNTGTGPALHVEQTGNNKVVEFLDDGVAVFSIANGGNITVKDSATVDGRDISVDGITTDNNFTTLNSNSARYDRTALSLETNVVPATGSWNSTNTTLVANSAGYSRTESSMVNDVATTSANWNTAYTHSQGSVTDHNDVSNAGSGQIITTDERDRFGRTWTNVSGTSANWNTAYTHSQGSVTDHNDVSNAGSGQIITADERDKFTRSWTNVSSNSARRDRTALSLETNVVGNSANWNTAYTHSQGSVTDHNDVSNAGSGQIITSDERDRFGRTWTNVSGNSARWDRTAYMVETDVVPNSASWNRTEQSMVNDVVTTSANWNTAYTHSQGNVTDHADVSNAGSGQIITADERDKFTRNWTNVSTSSASWNDAATNAYAVSADIAEIAALSANWNTAYTRSDGTVTIHNDVSNAGSGQIITTDERDKFTRNWTNVSTSSASWNDAATNAYAVSADIAEIAALSARWNRTESSMVNDVVGTSANWNTAYTHSQGNVTDHADVSNAGSGQIITTDERDKFTRTWTNVSSNSANRDAAYTHSQGSGSDHSLLGATAGTATASKALIVDSNKDIDLDGGDLTATNVTVAGDLTVQGATIQADTVVTVTSALSVTNTGTGPALHVEQTGNNKVVEFLDDGTSVFSIANGGNISVKSSATVDGRDISADGILIDRYFDDFTNIANVSGKWNRTESSMVNDVVTTSANWNTAYTHSQGNVTDHADVSNAGSGAIITTDERDKFTRNWTNVSTSSANWNSTYDQVQDSGTDLNIDSNTLVVDKSADHVGIGTAAPNEKLTVIGNVSATGGLNIGGNIIVGGSVDLRNVNEDGIKTDNNFTTLNSNSANWSTAYTHSQGSVTDHNDVSNAGSGQIITAAERSNLNSTNTTVKTYSADWNYTAANSAITLDTSSHNYLSISNREITLGEVDISDDTNLAANNGVTLTGDTLSIDSVSASNFTAAYDHSRGNVTDHADVSNAGSGQIITADERDRFDRTWTNVSGNSAQYATIFNSSEIAAASARYTQTALSLETNVVPNTADWNYVAANSALTLDDVTSNGSTTTNNIQVGTATITDDLTVKSGANALFTVDNSLSSVVYGTAPFNTPSEFVVGHPDGGANVPKLRLAGTTQGGPGTYGQIWFSSRTPAYSAYGAVIEGTSENVGVNVGALLFKVGFGATPAEKMRVDSNGNVGINQTNPSQQLDVGGNTKIAGNITVTGTVDGRDVAADGGVLDRHKLDMANIASVSANWTTGYNNSLSLEVARANVAATSGSWNSTNTTVKTYSADWNYVAANSGLTLDDITGNGATTSNNIQVGDATITGDLTVQGATIQADTIVTVTSALSVTNTGTGPALHVEQKGNNKVVEFLDDGTAIFSIANGGAITVGTWNGTAIANDYVAALPTSKITSGTFADARIASSNVTQHQGDITGTGALNSGSITSGFGNINNGTSSLTTGAVIAQQLRVTTTSAPSAYTSSGTKGDIAYDTNYLYICVSNNSWRRVALAIWE